MVSRLTWDSLAPAPYESAWSVYLKVLSANHISMIELEELIQLWPRRKGEAPRNYLDGRWIDFNRYASLLGIERERLSNGFLDQLGIQPIIPKPQIRPSIRHCPKCSALGYHCVLFNLAIIEECPWHRCKLTRSCERCSSPDTLNFERKHCIRCGALISLFVSAPRFNTINSPLHYTIIGYCREYLDWWAGVVEKTKHCPRFVSELLYTGTDDGFSMIAPMQLGLARKVSPGELFWKLSLEERPVQLISQTCILNKVKRPLDKYWLTDDVGRSLRSIRRHIYKRYLRAHHACINHLLSFSCDDVQFLDSEKVCMHAVAFLTWRMTVEGISNIEGVRTTRKKSVPLCLLRPDFGKYSLSIKDQIRWTYHGFFGLLSALERFHSQYWRFVIMKNDYSSSDGHLLWALIDPDPAPLKIAENRQYLMHILKPSAANLAEKYCPKWIRLSQEPNGSMLDVDAYNGTMGWWYQEPVDPTRRGLFKFTNSYRYRTDFKPLYQYFYV